VVFLLRKGSYLGWFIPGASERAAAAVLMPDLIASFGPALVSHTYAPFGTVGCRSETAIDRRVGGSVVELEVTQLTKTGRPCI
jgi:hypothetical protein